MATRCCGLGAQGAQTGRTQGPRSDAGIPTGREGVSEYRRQGHDAGGPAEGRGQRAVQTSRSTAPRRPPPRLRPPVTLAVHQQAPSGRAQQHSDEGWRPRSDGGTHLLLG